MTEATRDTLGGALVIGATAGGGVVRGSTVTEVVTTAARSVEKIEGSDTMARLAPTSVIPARARTVGVRSRLIREA